MPIGNLTVVLGVDFQPFIAGLKDAEREATAAAKAWKPLVDATKELGETMSVAGDVIAVGMFEAADKAAAYGAELEHLHERSGVSVEDLGKLAFAADQSGTSMEGLGTGLAFLSKNMELASTGSAKQQHAFEALGISAKDVNSIGGDANAMFLLLADRLQAIGDPSQNAADLTALLGRNWKELVPTLLLGSDGLKSAGEQAEYLGKVISDQTAQQDLQFEQMMKQIKSALEGTANAIGDALIPQLTSMASTVRDSIVDVTNFTKGHQDLTAAVFDTAVVIGTLGGALLAIGFGAPAVVTGLDSIAMASTAMGFSITAAQLGVVGLGAAIGVGIGTLINYGLQVTNTQKYLDQFTDGLLEPLKLLGLWADGQALVADADGKTSAGIQRNIDKIHSLGIEYDATGKSVGQINAETTKLIQEFYDVDPAADKASAAAKRTSDSWAQSAAEIAAANKKQREDDSKANDEYYKSLDDFYKSQRQLGLISADALMQDLIDDETNRFNYTDLADGNVATLTAKHVADLAKIRQDGYVAQLADDQKRYDAESKAEDQREADSVAVALLRLTDMQQEAQREYSLHAIADDALRDQAIFLEDRRWEILQSSHNVTEAEELAHTNRLLAIEQSYDDKIQSDNQKRIDTAAAADDARQADSVAAALMRLDDMQKADQREYALGEISNAAFRDQAIFLEDRRWEIMQSSHNVTEVETLAHYDRLSQIAANYSDVERAAQIKLAQDIEKEWSSSMNRLAQNVSDSLASMVVNWQFNADSLVNIAKGTAQSMLSALLDGMIHPLTNELAKLGASLTDTILGISTTTNAANKVTGGVANGGGLLGLVGGLLSGDKSSIPAGGPLAGVGDAAGTSFDIPKDTGSPGVLADIGSFLSSTTGIATLGIGAAVAGAIAWVKSQAHHEADDLVQTLQAPFDKNFASLVDMINIESGNGTLNQRDIVIAQVGMHELWKAVNADVEEWRTAKGDSSDRDKVAEQFHQTEDAFVATQIKWIDNLAIDDFWGITARDGTISNEEAYALPQYAMGTPWVPNDGPAYLHQGEAVIPAAQNTQGGSGNGTVNVNYDIEVNVAPGGKIDAMTVRDEIAPELKIMIQNNTRGLTALIARQVRATWKGVVAG